MHKIVRITTNESLLRHAKLRRKRFKITECEMAPCRHLVRQKKWHAITYIMEAIILIIKYGTFAMLINPYNQIKASLEGLRKELKKYLTQVP